MNSKKIISLLVFLGLNLAIGTGCKRFVFGEVIVSEENNPLIQRKVPRTGADLFIPPKVAENNLPNPDQGGAFHDWATCLIMLKEGHPHGGGKLHGNFVYAKAPWRQEQFVVIHNRANGNRVEVDRESVVTYAEKELGKKGPDYLRIIGGQSKLWGICFYFFDKGGNLINEKILEQSSRYQLFFSVSDLDSDGKPYDVMDMRYRPTGEVSIPSPYFQQYRSFEERRVATPRLFTYTYRDTWLHDDMADGVRDLFNLKLLPPFTRKNFQKAGTEDLDHVGLKGHLLFDFDPEAPIDREEDWPLLPLKPRHRAYDRPTHLLPHFYLAVRVLKCPEGKKALIPKSYQGGENKFRCAPSYEPYEASQWQELIRMNIPIRVYTSSFDTNPTNDDPHDPYFVNLGKEIGLSPEEAYNAANNIVIHGAEGTGGLGYGSWFL